MALTGQIKIYANLLADIGVRYPAIVKFKVTYLGSIVEVWSGYWLRDYLFCSRRFAGGVRFEPAASKRKFEDA